MHAIRNNLGYMHCKMHLNRFYGKKTKCVMSCSTHVEPAVIIAVSKSCKRNNK